MKPNKEMLRLRALLDERGIEYETYDLPNGEHGVSWTDCNGIEWEAVQQGENFEIHALQLVTPEQAIAATVGNRTDLASRLREVHGLHAFAELFGFDWYDESDWSWHDVACAMADAIDATAGTAMTLDQATEYAERFMGDYAKVLLASTLYVERDEPTDQHAFGVAEQKEAQMARDLAEALATVGVGTCVDKDSDPNDFKCSACGAHSFIQANDTYTTILDDHLTVLKKFNYCPNCGKRIIEEVTE